MSLKRILDLRHTVAFRLTFYYSCVFTASFFAAILVFYFIISASLERIHDHELKRDLRWMTAVLKSEGPSGLEKSLENEAASRGIHNIFFRIFDGEGKEIFATDMTHWGNMEISPEALIPFRNSSVYSFETRGSLRKENRVRIISGLIGPGYLLQIGESKKKDDEFLERFLHGFSVIMVLIIPFATWIGWIMGKRALQGVERIRQTALDISRGDLRQRVSVKPGNDEISELARTFNTMLDRVSVLVSGIRNMTDDIAHDLKKPISRIRVMAEKGLSYDGRIAHDEVDAARILEECDHLMQMINTMLDVSEAETGTARLHLEEVNLADIVRRAHELFYPLAEDKNLIFNADIQGSSIIRGDLHKIQRMIANLLDNALSYTQPGGEVQILLKPDTDKVEITVQDTGPGISAEDLPHIFERFFRCDRSRTHAGAGLGLTLAKAIAVSHGGDIRAQSCPGKGSSFTVTLPVIQNQPSV
jgi:signal transduction histidine kinase